MNMFRPSDLPYMQRCLQLARCGAGSTSPNPMVGAVLVCAGRIIGEGYHIRAGEPHAEVNAIGSVKECDRHLIPESTMYVSLEPCSHYGKTPPCCDLIISESIARVVVAVGDPNIQVNGRGIARMRNSGIEVSVGVLEVESYRLNRAFFTSVSQNRPMVVLKWAQSADGFIDRVRDDGSALCISSAVSRVAVHRLRSCADAILVGRRTAQLDNPALDVRLWAGKSPIRLVLDKEGKLPLSLKLFDNSQKTIVYTQNVREVLCGGNVEQVVLDFSQNIVPQILSHLHSISVRTLLVEGGALLLQSFIDASLWDVARVEVNAGICVGAGVLAPELPVGASCHKELCGGNEILHYSR